MTSLTFFYSKYLLVQISIALKLFIFLPLLMTAWQLLEGITIIWRSTDYHLMTNWRSTYDCLTTNWRPTDDWLTNDWQLTDNWLTKDWLPTDHWLLTFVNQLLTNLMPKWQQNSDQLTTNQRPTEKPVQWLLKRYWQNEQNSDPCIMLSDGVLIG